MSAPTAKTLRAAAASVRGARSMEIETAASKAAPDLLASANRWLCQTVPGLTQWDDPRKLQRVDAIESAARELAEALNLPAFRGECDHIIERGYQ